MTETGLILTDEIQADPYPDDHPWSVKIENRIGKNSVTIRQGGLGTRPVYVTDSDSGLIIGTDFAVLASQASCLTPCPAGRLELLLFGHTSGTRTLFNEIRRVSPGNRHLISQAGISSEWTDRLEDLGKTTIDDAVDCFVNGLKRRIESGQAGWLPLSGGVDSRTIASVISGTQSIRAYTRGCKKHPEVSRAETVSHVAGLHHYALPPPDDYLRSNAVNIVSLTGGMVSMDHGHAIHPLEHLKRLSGGIVLPGINGEYGRGFWLRGEGWRDGISVEDSASLLFHSALITRKGRYKNLFVPETEQAVDQLLAEFIERYNLVAEHSRFSHPIAWNDEFYLRERVRSFTAFGGVIWGSFFRLELPFLESDYVQAVRNLPPVKRKDPAIHTEIIRRTCPGLLRIALYPSNRMMAHRLRDLPSMMFRKMLGSISDRRLGKRVHDYAQSLRKERAFMEPFILKSAESACGLVHPETVVRIWNEHRKGTDHHRILARLATLAIADSVFGKPSSNGETK